MIKNVIFDKTFYNLGDIANLQIFSTQTGTSTITVLVSDDSDKVCSESVSREINSFSVLNISIPIIKNCLNPKASIVLSVGDSVLDSNNFQVTTVVSTTSQMTAKSNNGNMIIVILLVLIFGVVIYKKKYFNTNIFILAFIFSSIIFGSNFNSVSASVNILASSTLVSYGASTNISWNAANNDRCSITRSDSAPIWQNTGVSSFNLILQLTGFNQPYGLAVDSVGNLFVVDPYNFRIQKFNSSGTYLSSIIPSTQSGGGALNWPVAIAIDSYDNIYVTDTSNNRIKKFNSAGVFLLQFGTKGSGDGQFSLPQGVAIDSLGNVYVTDWGNNRVEKFNSSGVYMSKFGSFGSTDGTFWYPNGIAVDSSGYIYVADSHYRIDVFNSSGVYVTKFGGPGDGLGFFADPFAITFSKTFFYHNNNNESLFVVDDGKLNFQVLSSYGIFQQLSGGFNSGKGISVDDKRGYLYITTTDNRVLKFAIVSSGSKSSGPLTTTTTFTATCLPSNNTSSVTVSVIPLPPVVTLTPTSNSVPYNGSTTISWTASDSNSCTMYKSGNSLGAVNSSAGSISSGNLISNTVFSLSCIGLGGGPTIASSTVSILPPVISFAAAINPAPYNSSTNLFATTTNSTSCTLIGNGNTIVWNNPSSISTSTGILTSNTTFSLSCTGPGGTLNNNLIVAVLPPPSVGISAASNSVTYGNSTTISWNSAQSTSCKIRKNGDVFATSTSGSQDSGPLNVYTTFAAECLSGYSSTTNYAIVKIAPTVNLSSDSALIPSGSSTTIYWSSTGADSCVIKKDGSLLGESTSTSGNISSGALITTSIITAMCANNYASTTKSLTIITDPIIEGVITPITISLSSYSSSVSSGSSTNITWNSTGADSCTITKSGDSSSIASGKASTISSGPLTSTTTFTVVCTNSYTANKITYNYNGEFTVPSGVNSIKAKVWGGGGGGGLAINGGGAGGGGGGGYSEQTFNVTPGDIYDITVGNGGVAGSNGLGFGQPGETSSFGTLISAFGGSAGQGPTPSNNWRYSGGGVGGSGITANGGNGGAGVAPYQQYILNLQRYVWINGYGGSGGAGGSPGAGSGGAGGGVGMGYQWGGVGAKGMVVITPDSGSTGIYPYPKSITIGIIPKPNQPIELDFGAEPLSVSSGSSTNIWWDQIGADSCKITGNNGDSLTTVFPNGSMTSAPITSDTVYTVVCKNSDTSATSSVTISIINNPEVIGPLGPLGPIISTCTSTQSTSPDGNFYINRETKWEVTLSTTTALNLSTAWSGTNISGTVNGNPLSKIYTTIGPKTINAITSGKINGEAFNTECSGAIIIKLTGSTGEI